MAIRRKPLKIVVIVPPMFVSNLFGFGETSCHHPVIDVGGRNLKIKAAGFVGGHRFSMGRLDR